MDNATHILYDGFPRTVASSTNGQLRQHFVHSESEFDLWFDSLKDERNLYSSTCRFRSDMRSILDKVFLDLDSPFKESAFEAGTSDVEKINLMRNDEELADEVLGSVWDDAQCIAKKCMEEEIPLVSVFSGLGIHMHMLYRDRVNPVKEKVSTSQWMIEECDTNTHDIKVIPDVRRVLRVPNSKRVSEGAASDVWCIPITETEILENTIHELLDRCSRKKGIPYKKSYRKVNRPDMQVYEGYEDLTEDAVGTIPLNNVIEGTEMDELVEEQVRDALVLPCVRDRFFSSNPDHYVRFNGCVLLYQAGYSPKEVQEIIKKLGWVDYDKDITRKMTRQIYRNKYSEFSCKTLQSRGLCVFGPTFDKHSDNPKDCSTYNWPSGEAIY